MRKCLQLVYVSSWQHCFVGLQGILPVPIMDLERGECVYVVKLGGCRGITQWRIVGRLLPYAA